MQAVKFEGMVLSRDQVSDAKKQLDRPQKTALGYFIDAVAKVNSAITGVIAVGLSILVADVLDKQVPGWLAALIGVSLLLFCVALLQALRAAVRAAESERATLVERLTAEQRMLPVKKILKSFPPFKNAICVLLVESEHRLQEGSHVTIVVKEDGVERPLGSGTVRKRQEDNFTQVTLDHVYDAEDPQVKAAREQTDIKDRLFVARHSSFPLPSQAPVAPESKPDVAPMPTEAPQLSPEQKKPDGESESG